MDSYYRKTLNSGLLEVNLNNILYLKNYCEQ